jgi:hypothetical protein
MIYLSVVEPKQERREDNRRHRQSHEHNKPEPKTTPRETPAPEPKDSLLKNIMVANEVLELFKMFGEGQEQPIVPPSPLNPPTISVPVPSLPPQFQTNLLMNPHTSFMPSRQLTIPPEPEIVTPVEEPRVAPQPKPAGSFSTYVLNTLSQFYNVFQSAANIPKNATNTVYVEGIPFEATEREVARISVFHPSYRYFQTISRLSFSSFDSKGCNEWR